MRPRLALGLGCDRGTPEATLRQAIDCIGRFAAGGRLPAGDSDWPSNFQPRSGA